MRLSWIVMTIISVSFLFVGSSQAATLSKKEPSPRKQGDWIVTHYGNHIHQVDSVDSVGVHVSAYVAMSNSKKRFKAYYVYPSDQVDLITCDISKDSISIVNVDKNNKQLLLIYRGDHVTYGDSLHQEKYAFDMFKETKEGYETMIRSLKGTSFGSNYSYVNGGKFVKLHNVLNEIKSVERKYFKQRLEKYPYNSIVTWKDQNGIIQKAKTQPLQIETDSIRIYMYSNSNNGERINRTILPDDFEFLDNSTASYQDTLMSLIDTVWSVPDKMFDYVTIDCSQLLLKEGQEFSLLHESISNEIQFFTFSNPLHLLRQTTKYRYKVKMGYKGDWQLIDGKLHLQLEGGGSYHDKVKNKETRNKWKHDIVFEVLDASINEFKLKTLAIQSEKL